MKKLFLLMIAIGMSFSASAQTIYSLTPKGLRPAEDLEQDFVVLEFEGKTQKELYSAVHSKLLSMYVSPKDVLSVDGEFDYCKWSC